MDTDSITRVRNLRDLMSPAALELLSAGGGKLVQQIGIEVVRGVVYDVLIGKNLRDSTEVLTRRRIAALNLATVRMFVQGAATWDGFIKNLPQLAVETLRRKRISKAERWIALWVLGLTEKASQNVLRDDPQVLAEYQERYTKACQDVIVECEREQGVLSGVLELDSGVKAQINWLFLTYLLNTVGAQTLAIRGSEKSSYGKLFEKLVLGSLLHILGFKHVSPEQPERFERVFWLSSRGERRESDATLLYEAGKGVRFDISAGSRIERLAQEVDGTIVQMSMAYWPQQVARELYRVLGFRHALVDMEQSRIGAYLRAELSKVPLEEFIGLGNGEMHNGV